MASSTETGNRPPLGEAFGQHRGCSGVDIPEPHARLGSSKTGIGGVEHGLIDFALDIGERPP